MSLDPLSNPVLGTALHAVGGTSAALCYTPQRFLHKWSWQTYWLVQASLCWLILPWLFAFFILPEFGAVLSEAPAGAMLLSYLLGVAYGVGGIAFGIAIRYIGFSLTYAIAIGVSCLLGTFLAPILAAVLGELQTAGHAFSLGHWFEIAGATTSATLAKTGSSYVVFGVLLGTAATMVTGYAGFRKEREIGGDYALSDDRFNPRKGLLICLLAGVLSAVYGLALQAGQPIADVARAHGAGHFESLAIYCFSNPGAFTTTVFYTAWLAARGGTWGEFVRTADGVGLGKNYLLAGATGLMWYLQFFFYGLGHVRMGSLKFSSWAIHMILLILLSAGFGVAIGEWKKCRGSTRAIVLASIALLLGAVGLISRGNYLAEQPVVPAASSGH